MDSANDGGKTTFRNLKNYDQTASEDGNSVRIYVLISYHELLQ